MTNDPIDILASAPEPAGRIQDEAEVARWIVEGRTYPWMSEEYERRYNITTAPSLWEHFRRERGLTRSIIVGDGLVPWDVAAEHRWAYPLVMLRVEARLRAGWEITALDRGRVESWRDNLAEGDLVVAYDRRTTEGFSYVPRRAGIDTDLVRVPTT